MFRLHLDAGYRKMMVLEFAKGMIHYLDEADGTVAIMGPLQPGEGYAMDELVDLAELGIEYDEPVMEEEEEVDEEQD